MQIRRSRDETVNFLAIDLEFIRLSIDTKIASVLKKLEKRHQVGHML